MCLAIFSHNAAAIQCKQHWQFTDTHIMQDLIVSPLHKSRIQRYNRLQSSRSHSRRKCHCMFFCDSYIKETVGIFFCKSGQSGSIRHSRTDRYQVLMDLGTFDHPLSKDLCIGKFLFFLDLACPYIKRPHTVEISRPLFCRSVSFSFLCQHMDQYRLIFYRKGGSESRQHLLYIVAVHRSHIDNAHVFKQHSRNK